MSVLESSAGEHDTWMHMHIVAHPAVPWSAVKCSLLRLFDWLAQVCKPCAPTSTQGRVVYSMSHFMLSAHCRQLQELRPARACLLPSSCSAAGFRSPMLATSMSLCDPRTVSAGCVERQAFVPCLHGSCFCDSLFSHLTKLLLTLALRCGKHTAIASRA